jgi:hypothetical protein
LGWGITVCPAWGRVKEIIVKPEVFIREFAKEDVPEYPCPSCGKSKLSKKAFVSDSNAATKRNDGSEDWEPDWDEYVFSLTLECKECLETVLVSGDGYVDEEIDVDEHENWSRQWVVKYRPKYFFPALRFIEYPQATPREVKQSVDSAAALFYAHPGASCNSLRMAAEEVLTSLGVAEARVGEFVSLASRIKSLPEDSAERNLLDAIRWQGNDGSHSKSIITHADAEDTFNLMNLLIEEVYSDRKRKIQELAKAINEHKGPVRLRGFKD